MDSPYQSSLKVFRLANLNLLTLPLPFLSMESTIKSLAHHLPSLLLPPDWSWCFSMWPCMAWPAPSPWELWVASSLFNGSCLLIFWPPHTWIMIKPTFWNNIRPYLILDWCGQGNPGYISLALSPVPSTLEELWKCLTSLLLSLPFIDLL